MITRTLAALGGMMTALLAPQVAPQAAPLRPHGPRFNLLRPRLTTRRQSRACERCGRQTLVPPERCTDLRHRRSHVYCLSCRMVLAVQTERLTDAVFREMQGRGQMVALMQAPPIGRLDN